jgi:transcriptional regulator
MYIPEAFRINDLPALHDAMAASRLSNLITATEEGPLATPLPLFLVRDEGPNGTLYGHLARANPQWKHPPIGDAMALFMGPDAYISPSCYATKREHGKVVPTWNYVTIHAYGTIEFFEDTEKLRDVVTRLTNLYEQPRAEPWAVTDAPAPFIAAQLRGIIGLRLPIKRLEGKRKLSQNRSAADQAGVAAALAASDRPTERATAELMTDGWGSNFRP